MINFFFLKHGISAYGKYDAITNTIFYSEEISDKCLNNKVSSECHEMWYMKHVENYINKYGDIIEKNYFEYINSTCDEA